MKPSDALSEGSGQEIRARVSSRPYTAIVDAVRGLPGEADEGSRMRVVADAVWEHLHRRGVSWGGFYVPDPDDDHAMVLGPMRDKPACSPIGLHGMCGASYTSRAAVIVDDVATLGEGYIACDPKDVSEVVVPLLDADGSCFGVLDLDSYDRASFDEGDVIGLLEVLMAAGLTSTAEIEIVRY